jgi:hypothetical protein
MRAGVGILVAVCMVGATQGWAAPKPSIAPVNWELGFSYHDPHRITLTLPGDDTPTSFWYVLYTVTNTTDREVPFYPTFDIVTDQLQVVAGGEQISPSVYDAIRVRHAKAYPFFVNPAEMYGLVLTGEDNARTSAIAFRDLDPEVNHFALHVGGLSGEVARVRNPGYDHNSPVSASNTPFFVLRKTLAISYDIPGDPRTRMEAIPVRVKQEWVMR